MGTLTFWNPLGHSRPVMGLLYLLYQCEDEYKNICFAYSTIIYAIHPQLKCGVQCNRNTDTARNVSHHK